MNRAIRWLRSDLQNPFNRLVVNYYFFYLIRYADI